ncbi:GLPGLI family protein [Chryseobacterium luquanense]|uniref:GLPGLI family protein n=1 Tax=Chryseobacterium luquanense TaxID=2983766 RepID=A0ABT3Y255_9FLAO|nr:GLPGLI family protein [Chryseobacterium luquanense]MCX8532202.1 GLPGLI family protein [Chryseobacterium luquanense]
MKLLTTFSLLLIATLANAQNKRFIYEYQFIPDSTNVSEVKSEMMNLDVSDEGSQFYSYDKYSSDSLRRAEIRKMASSGGAISISADAGKGSVKYKISKKYPGYNVFFHNRVLLDNYKVAEERKINWKISSEKQKIGEWNTQKAETDFSGRHWTAWFTSDIPIQDGPYKFHGLPGLIVKLEDKTKSHIFNLQGIKNIEELSKDIISDKNISINQKQYDKLIRDFEKDPTSGLKMIQSGGITMKMVDGQNNHMKEMEQRQIEKIKKDNNRIELVNK